MIHPPIEECLKVHCPAPPPPPRHLTQVIKSPTIFADSKPLRSLLEHLSTLQRICVVLDTPPPGCGCYKEVAQYYGFDHYMRESVLKPFEGGPSSALIEFLAATYPELTVHQFAVVVWKKTKREDVPDLLRKYDSTEEKEICKD